MEINLPLNSDLKLRDESGRCHGVLPYLNEAPSLTVWQVQSRRTGVFLRSPHQQILWFKQPPDLFPCQRFPFEQGLFDSFHPGVALL